MTLLQIADRRRSQLWRFLSITLIFLVLWPPIFGIVGWWMKFDFGIPSIGWLTAIAMFSYLACAPSALAAGLIHATTAVRFHRDSLLVPVATAGVGALVTIARIVLPLGSFKDIFGAPTESYVLFFFASLMASLICWRLARPLSRLP
jgi:hypothetical protein